MSAKQPVIRTNEKPVDVNADERIIEFGSDALAETLSRLSPQVEYIALNPGSSYRGLHDSLVNYAANESPKMLLCVHEEHAVAIAHGYAKVADRPMAVALHANVGLQHGIMAIYNAFCDRVPMLILGAGGPFDATERRPWIDHTHTSGDQAAMIRQFIKWDDQPATVQAAVHAIVRAYHSTTSVPHAPTYVCLDVTLQEKRIKPEDVVIPDISRYLAAKPAEVGATELDVLIDRLRRAKRPLFLIGRVNRSEQAWQERIELVEALGAAVVTDLKNGSAFPYPHPRHPAPPSTFISAHGCELIRCADLLVSVDWIDFSGTLKLAFGGQTLPRPDTFVVTVSLDAGLHNGWVKDSGNLPLADLPLQSDANRFFAALHERIIGKNRSNYTNGVAAESSWPPQLPARTDRSELGSTPYILQTQFANGVYDGASQYQSSLIRSNLGWNALDMRADHPLSYLGADGGAGLASGPGMLVGSALALMKKDGLPSRLPMAILGDGDTLMGSGAMWTAAHYRIPCLYVIANNCSFYNDEVHQEKVAKTRSRPVANKWIGMSMTDPEPNLSMLARSYGLLTPPSELIGKTNLEGQVQDGHQLVNVIRWAAEQVMEHGKSVLVDVRVRPDGYAAAAA